MSFFHFPPHPMESPIIPLWSHYAHSSLSQFSTALASCSEGKGWVDGGLGTLTHEQGLFLEGWGGRIGDGGDGWRGGERRWFTPALVSERLVRIMFAAGVWAVGGGGGGGGSHPDFTQVCNLTGPPAPPAHTHRTIFAGEVNTQTRQRHTEPQGCASECVRDQRLPTWDTSCQSEARRRRVADSQEIILVILVRGGMVLCPWQRSLQTSMRTEGSRKKEKEKKKKEKATAVKGSRRCMQGKLVCLREMIDMCAPACACVLWQPSAKSTSQGKQACF